MKIPQLFEYNVVASQVEMKWFVDKKNMLTGELKIIEQFDTKREAEKRCGELTKKMAESAYKQGQDFGEWLKRDERRKEEGKKAKELSRLVRKMQKKKKEDEERRKNEKIIEKIKEEMEESVEKITEEIDEIEEETEEIEEIVEEELPDIFVKCLDNTGYEENFEVGVSYVFKGKDEDFFLVEDMFARDIQVFQERFEVLPLEYPWTIEPKMMKPVRLIEMKTIECEDCGGEGLTMTMKCYGGMPHEVDEECKTCGGEGKIEVPVDGGDAELAVERPPNLVNYLWK